MNSPDKKGIVFPGPGCFYPAKAGKIRMSAGGLFRAPGQGGSRQETLTGRGFQPGKKSRTIIAYLRDKIAVIYGRNLE
jgi:hypothetical protein